MIKLYFTALIQVMLVAMNVIFISKGMMLPMLITAFSISYIWAFNVTKIVTGNKKENTLVYALGASTGTFIGYHTAHYLQTIY